MISLKEKNLSIVRALDENSLVNLLDHNSMEQIIESKLFDPSDFDNIIFVEPSSGLSEDALQGVLKTFPIACAHKWENSSEPYHARGDDKRFNQLKNALCGERKFLWVLRGGYGSARLFNALESYEFPYSSKVIVGYSDATFLHLYANQRGWKTIHGAMPVDSNDASKDPKNFTLLKRMMEERKGVATYGGMIPMNDSAFKNRTITGDVIGGNLTLLTNSLGTRWQLNGKNKIILMEDVGSKGYVIDRDLTHLMQTGVLTDVRAIILGTFTQGDEQVDYALNRFAVGTAIPVFKASFFGHGSQNYPVPLGFNASILSQEDENTFALSVTYDFGE